MSANNIGSWDEARPEGAEHCVDGLNGMSAADYLREIRVCLKNSFGIEHDLATGEILTFKGTESDRDSIDNPGAHMLFINTDTGELQYYDESASEWKNVIGEFGGMSILSTPVKVFNDTLHDYWVQLDLSSYLPSDATGVILNVLPVAFCYVRPDGTNWKKSYAPAVFGGSSELTVPATEGRIEIRGETEWSVDGNAARIVLMGYTL